MAGFGDFMQAIQFGLGLAGGFSAQAQKERDASEKSQLDLLKILHDDENTLVPADNEPNNAGFLGTLFGAPGGQDSYRIGGRSFRLQPKPKLSFDLGEDTSTASAATAAPARGLGTYSPFGGAMQSQPQTTTSQPQAALSKTAVPADKQKVAQLVVQIAREQGIPEDKIKDVVAIAHHESGFRPDAEGRAGEIGVMQLMPANVKLFNVNDPYDPTQNITGGVKLYKTLLNKYGNDSDKATAAYNAGERPVDAGNIPRSTQAYVRNVRSTANTTYSQFANMVAGPGAPAQEVSQQNQLPKLTSEVVGKLPDGRPIVRTEDGGVSTHRTITEVIDGKWYNIPTMYGGKEVSPTQAMAIARKNNFTDPDTNQPLTAYSTLQEAEAADRAYHTDVLPQQLAAAGVQPQAAPQAAQSFLQTPVETEAQRVTAAKRNVLRQYQGQTDTEKNRLARGKDVLAAGEKAKADYRGEQSAVRADLTKLLENEHRPTVLKAAKEVLTYAQLAELTQKARDVPDVPWFTLVPQFMKQAIAQGQGDRAAADVYQEMTAANFKTDIIDRLLETSGYTDIKKQRTAAAEARGRLGVEAEEGPKVIRAKAPAEADAAAQKQAALDTQKTARRTNAFTRAQVLADKGLFDQARQVLNAADIPPKEHLQILQEDAAVGEQTALSAGKAGDRTKAQRDSDALLAKGDKKGAAEVLIAHNIELPPDLKGFEAELKQAGENRAQSRVFKGTTEETTELDKLLADRKQSGELPTETTRDEFAQLFPEAVTMAQQNVDKRKADVEQTQKRIAANAPLHPTDVQKFINPQTGQRAPAIIDGQPATADKLQKLGMIPLDTVAQRAVSERLTALDNLKTMRVLAFGGKDARGEEHPGIFKVPGGFGSRTSATVESYLKGLKQDTQHGIDLKALEALQEGLLSVYARGVAGERGNVATQDTERIRTLFPTVSLSKFRFQSSEPLAEQLYNQLEDIITAPLTRIIGNGTIGASAQDKSATAPNNDPFGVKTPSDDPLGIK